MCFHCYICTKQEDNIMRKWSLFTALTLMILTFSQAQAQDYYPEDDKPEVTGKQLQKEAKKKKMAIIDSVRFNSVEQAIKEGYFVVLVERVSLSYSGHMESALDHNRNFILVQTDGGIVQTSSSWGYPGFNNMGGVTLSGKVTNYRISKGKKGDLSVSYNLVGRNTNANVYISITRGSDQATATVTPTMGRGSFTMYGRIAPYRNPNLQIEQ